MPEKLAVRGACPHGCNDIGYRWQCRLVRVEYRPASRPDDQHESKGQGGQQAPEHLAGAAMRGAHGRDGRVCAHLRSNPQRATVMFSIGCTIRRSMMM